MRPYLKKPFTKLGGVAQGLEPVPQKKKKNLKIKRIGAIRK
jgi:hypothetical protein